MLLGACRKPRPSDPSWRGSLRGAGEAPTRQHTGSVARVAPALSPVHPALLLLLGRAARGSSTATLPGAPLPCRELWGRSPAWQGPSGEEWVHPDLRCVPQARPNIWLPWCRPGHPATPSCSQAIPPDPALPPPPTPLHCFRNSGWSQGEKGTPLWTPVTTHRQALSAAHPPQSPNGAAKVRTRCSPVLTPVLTPVPGVSVEAEARTRCAVPTRWHHQPQRNLGQRQGRNVSPQQASPPGQHTPAQLRRHSLEAWESPPSESKLLGHCPAAGKGLSPLTGGPHGAAGLIPPSSGPGKETGSKSEGFNALSRFLHKSEIYDSSPLQLVKKIQDLSQSMCN